MLRVYVWLYLLFLGFPIAIIVLFAFHSSTALSFPFEGFSLRWFEQLLADSSFLSSLKNSVIVAVATSVATCFLGTTAALALVRLSPKPREAFAFLNFMPIAVPGLFIGASLLVLFDSLGIYRSLVTVVLAHTVFCLPFFFEAVRTRVSYFDLDLELAARDLGATKWQAFRLVTLPLLLPTIVGGTILTFALSFDEIIITVFVIGEQSTLPFYILSQLRRTVTPVINAASVFAIGVTLLALLAAGMALWWQAKREKSERIGTGVIG